MLSANRYAFKEWAVVCHALGTGRQSLILRKGGLHEPRDGFQMEHSEFWLFPTRFHQDPAEISADARVLWEAAQMSAPLAGTIDISLYATVEEAVRVDDIAVLPRLTGLHAWSDETLRKRFDYKTPGLSALLVRVYSLPAAIRIPESPHFAGCRSWVDFPADIPTTGLQPVLNDDEAARTFEDIRRAIRGPVIA